MSNLDEALQARSGDKCELCGQTSGLDAHLVSEAPDSSAASHVVVCDICHPQLADGTTPDSKHWFCLQEAIWSEVDAVKVVSWRMLHRLTGESWAQDLLDQAYLGDEAQAWAKAGLSSEVKPTTLDSNGTRLADGDSVTLIKDLKVKGASFTAKRGTLVKGIRLTDDPTHVEGRVNKVAIYLKTEFLKKV